MEKKAIYGLSNKIANFIKVKDEQEGFSKLNFSKIGTFFEII
jgi:hypothetical protein